MGARCGSGAAHWGRPSMAKGVWRDHMGAAGARTRVGKHCPKMTRRPGGGVPSTSVHVKTL